MNAVTVTPVTPATPATPPVAETSATAGLSTGAPADTRPAVRVPVAALEALLHAAEGYGLLGWTEYLAHAEPDDGDAADVREDVERATEAVAEIRTALGF